MTSIGRPAGPLSALVVHESMFGNTERIAEAVVRGLRKNGFEAHAVPSGSLAATGPIRVDLLVLGAPTHAFSLSRPQTRADAVRQGAPAHRAEAGLRDWIALATPQKVGTDRVVVFDTRVARVRRLRVGAGTVAARLLRRRGFHLLRKPVAFLVEDTPGPLCAGEEARAERWGQMMAAACREERVAATGSTNRSASTAT